MSYLARGTSIFFAAAGPQESALTASALSMVADLSYLLDSKYVFEELDLKAEKKKKELLGGASLNKESLESDFTQLKNYKFWLGGAFVASLILDSIAIFLATRPQDKEDKSFLLFVGILNGLGYVIPNMFELYFGRYGYESFMEKTLQPDGIPLARDSSVSDSGSIQPDSSQASGGSSVRSGKRVGQR